MDPIRSLDELDPVQRYMRRRAVIRCVLLVVVLVLLALAVYWGIFR
jgi:hypothetical protein